MSDGDCRIKLTKSKYNPETGKYEPVFYSTRLHMTDEDYEKCKEFLKNL